MSFGRHDYPQAGPSRYEDLDFGRYGSGVYDEFGPIPYPGLFNHGRLMHPGLTPSGQPTHWLSTPMDVPSARAHGPAWHNTLDKLPSYRPTNTPFIEKLLPALEITPMASSQRDPGMNAPAQERGVKSTARTPRAQARDTRQDRRQSCPSSTYYTESLEDGEEESDGQSAGDADSNDGTKLVRLLGDLLSHEPSALALLEKFSAATRARIMDFLRAWRAMNPCPECQAVQMRDNDDSMFLDADVIDEPTSVAIHAELPGARKDDISVEWDGLTGTITIAAEVKRPGEAADGSEEPDGPPYQWLCRERKVGRFRQEIELPKLAGGRADVDAKGMTAQLQDGVLVVRLPKVEKKGKQVKRVDVE